MDLRILKARDDEVLYQVGEVVHGHVGEELELHQNHSEKTWSLEVNWKVGCSTRRRR